MQSKLIPKSPENNEKEESKKKKEKIVLEEMLVLCFSLLMLNVPALK